MTIADWVLVLMWIGLTAYALLGGADFGGGFWDLFAGGPKKGSAQRELIERSIGPVWEANHVWLIFVLVVLWSGFPRVFAAIASTLYIPLTLAAFGIILRGSGFVFRKVVNELRWRRLFGASFALSSILTPFFLGTIAGSVASGRVPLGNAAGHPVSSWINPTSLLGGAMAVGVCAYLAAVYLTADAERQHRPDLADAFRARGLGMAVATGILAVAGIFVLHADAPQLYTGLTHRALPLIIASAVGGLASIALLWFRRFVLARLAAALAVTAVLWGWGAAQYPEMLVDRLTVAQAASAPATLQAVLISLIVGSVFFVPGLILLLALFQRPDDVSASESPPSQG